MAGPAMARDYVKCEAMERASDRALAAFEKEAEPIIQEGIARAKRQYCGTSTDWKCTEYALDVTVPERNYVVDNNPHVKRLLSIYKKIVDDQMKAGCFF
jgi:hypothetical protein